jgi:hypothetical protein
MFHFTGTFSTLVPVSSAVPTVNDAAAVQFTLDSLIVFSERSIVILQSLGM